MKISNLCVKSVVSFAVVAACYAAVAAENGRSGRAAMMTSSARMPTMPTVSMNTIGNPAVTTVDANNITPAPTPTPKPSGCPDGGVKDSTYTVTMCMNDIRQCVDNGALQGGLRDLFNEDVRNSILGGMRICQEHVDKCIKEVRVDCRNVYIYSNDVWLDFNSRIVQPEYYNFVLRKTGLTPNQAENTCLLLDRNTYGSSFAAVSDVNGVNTEFANRVGAYNEADNGKWSKANPQGAEVNTEGYSGNRGHYARWDASNAECLIRVAAYNKDKLITNSWLFGAVGDNNPAEVWEKAGSTFTCNKDLFDFSSLLNDTKTAAVVGVTGGAVLGTAIGAAAGAGVYNKKKAEADKAKKQAEEDMYKDPCEDEEYRKKLGYQIQKSHKDQVLKTYLYESVSLKEEGGKKTTEIANAVPVFEASDSFYNLTVPQCRAIHSLYSKVELYKSAINYCNTHLSKVTSTITVPNVVAKDSLHITDVYGNSVKCEGQKVCGFTEQELTEYKNNCLFLPLQVGLSVEGENNPLCNHNGKCVTVAAIQSEIKSVQSLLNELESVVSTSVLAKAQGKEPNKGKEIGKGAAIGLATGAGVGGIVTGITALVERSNISCKVGDGLASVSLDKAYTIESLKDFYVKWNLNLPDSVYPTAAVLDMESWYQACSQFNSRLSECPNVKVHFKKNKEDKNYTLVNTACKVSGNMCIVNESVARTYIPIK